MSVVSAKSKKGKANGFLLFLLDYKRENNLDMNEAQMRAGEAWMVSDGPLYLFHCFMFHHVRFSG